MEVKGLLAATANRLGFLDAYASLRGKMGKSQVAVLVYHRVSPPQVGGSLEPLNTQIFEKQTEGYCRDYEVISLDELTEKVYSGKPLPSKAVVITFDDGYKDNYLHAYPILKRHHIPATIFLTTGHIGTNKPFWWDRIGYVIQHTSVSRLSLGELGDYSLQSAPDKSRASLTITKRLQKLPEARKGLLIERLINTCQVDIPPNLGQELILSWDEIREMSSNGISFGAHSVNHPILTNIPLKQAKDEIILSKKEIEKRLNREVSAFAYPNGDFNTEIVKLVKQAGFTCAVTVSDKFVSIEDDPYKLNRIWVCEDPNKFKVMFCGLWGDLRSVLNR